ncbi:hypothetical protein FNV43_RR19496 [Rhamnella rubrinervis]|uniref:Cytochrome P450 n=1 Tax=Rhamnella rubrinervis TaxID=2594499 RepID=A0A8K0E4L1_9ROSA|nr:hypothetical protein FNV43_RR19496 [Rhamnella rubrinervis]
MLLRLGQVATLVVSSADMVREIIKNHDIAFSNRPKATVIGFLFNWSNDMAFTSYGMYWRQTRKICVVELLSLKRVQEFHYVREEEVATFVNRIHKASIKTGLDCVNLSELMIATFNNAVSRCVVFKCYMEEDGVGKLVLYWEVLVEMGRRIVAWEGRGLSFSCLEWIDVLRGFLWRLKVSSGKLNVVSDQVVGEHKAVLGLGADMLLAGTDTSSIGLGWLMAELIRHPKVTKKAQEQLRALNFLEANHIPANAKVFINAWFIPFGSGRRVCLGMTFGVASIEYMTANLLYWFDFKLPEDGCLGKELE